MKINLDDNLNKGSEKDSLTKKYLENYYKNARFNTKILSENNELSTKRYTKVRETKLYKNIQGQ